MLYLLLKTNLYIKLMCMMVVMIKIAFARRVYWFVRTNPMIIGEDIELFCNTSTESKFCHGCPMIWSGWSGNRIINKNGHSFEPHKFEVFSENDGYSLKIKQFSKSDCLYSYTCSYGFAKFTNSILSYMAGDNLISLPHKNETSVHYNASENGIEANVFLQEVSPRPRCNVWISGYNVSHGLTQDFKENMRFFNATLKFVYHIQKNTLCNFLFEINCTFADEEIVIFKETFKNNCSEPHKEDPGVTLWILFSFPPLTILVIIIIIVSIAIIMFWNRKNGKLNEQLCGSFAKCCSKNIYNSDDETSEETQTSSLSSNNSDTITKNETNEDEETRLKLHETGNEQIQDKQTIAIQNPEYQQLVKSCCRSSSYESLKGTKSFKSRKPQIPKLITFICPSHSGKNKNRKRKRETRVEMGLVKNKEKETPPSFQIS